MVEHITGRSFWLVVLGSFPSGPGSSRTHAGLPLGMSIGFYCETLHTKDKLNGDSWSSFILDNALNMLWLYIV